MKLSDWASVAEILSAIAVVITLLVLVAGVRENTATIRATAAAESRDSLSSLDDLILTLDNEILEVFARLDREARWEDFTPAEQYRINAVNRAFLRRAEAQYFRYRNGLLAEDVWSTVLTRVVGTFQLPVLREWWGQQKQGTFTADFVLVEGRSHGRTIPLDPASLAAPGCSGGVRGMGRLQFG